MIHVRALCGLLLAISSYCSLVNTTLAFAPVLSSLRSRTTATSQPSRYCGPLHASSSESSSSSSVAASTSSLFRNVAAVNGSNITGDTVFHSGSSSSSNNKNELSRPVAALTKAGMIAYIVCMCIALPVTLYPQKALYKIKLISKKRKERWAVNTGQFCARNLLRLIPFCSLETFGVHDPNPQPAIWVCNHTSMLDVFLLLAADKKLRGKKKRPIKIVYWKALEANPVTKVLFRQAGFISVAVCIESAIDAS